MPDQHLHIEPHLLIQISEGNEQAFSHFYKVYQPVVKHYLQIFTKDSMVAEELIQEVFFRLWDNKVSLKEAANLKAYILRIAKNLAIDHLRREQLKSKLLTHLQHTTEPSDNTVEETLAYRQLTTLIKQAIDLLPPGRKQVFQLSTETGLSYDEIAASLKISKSVVKKQFYASLASIRTYLTEHGALEAGVLFLSIFRLPPWQ